MRRPCRDRVLCEILQYPYVILLCFAHCPKTRVRTEGFCEGPINRAPPDWGLRGSAADFPSYRWAQFSTFVSKTVVISSLYIPWRIAIGGGWVLGSNIGRVHAFHRVRCVAGVWFVIFFCRVCISIHEVCSTFRVEGRRDIGKRGNVGLVFLLVSRDLRTLLSLQD